MDARTHSREEVVEKIMGELEPLVEAHSPEEVQEYIGEVIDGRYSMPPTSSTGSKRTAQNLKKRFDALIEALADTDDIYIKGWIKLDHHRIIMGDPDRCCYSVEGFGGLYLDRHDLLDILKDVQHLLATYKSASRTTVLKKHCAEAAHQLITAFSERSPSMYDDGPMRRITELIYGFHTGDYTADVKRACDLTVNEGRAGRWRGDEFEF
jgi:hypothetical protein